MNLVFRILVQQPSQLTQFGFLSKKVNSAQIYSIIKIPIYFIFICCTLTLCSCTDSASEEFEIIQTNSPFDFHCIEEYQGSIYASGGDVCNKSNLVYSTDGFSWTTDSLTNKSVFDLFSDGESLYGVGNDGYIFSGQPDLQLSRTRFWGLLRGFTASNNGFIAVGGKDFNKGWAYRVNKELQVDTANFYENELHDVLCNDSGRCLACGYGVILISDDEGITWQRSTETGDFYNSIAQNSDGRLFIVGYSGTIIQSDDNGNSWSKIKNGNSPIADNKPFRTIKFNGEKGVIIGDNGLIWISFNNGADWEDISIKTELDLIDFIFYQDQIMCASESGKIISISI